MNFKKTVWDDSDPTYAPCMSKARNSYRWIAPKKYRVLGYEPKTYMLTGKIGDGLDLERAAQARALTREMLEWYEGQTHGAEYGTWDWIITRYLVDEYSDFHDVRPNTREKYKQILDRIRAAIGNVRLSDTDYTRMKQWQKAMSKKGRSTSYIKRWFTHLGLAISHGVKIGDADCLRIKTIRSEMRIKTPPRRSSYITREQVDLVVQDADSRGMHHVALSVLFRFEYMLRGVDVYGQWVPSENTSGGITWHGRRWEDGLTWDMVSPDLTSFEKVISKTRNSLPEPYTFDLTSVPEIRNRLAAVPAEKRTGPVIVDATGMPPKQDYMTKAFKAIVRHLGLPDDLRISDNRAGGITEAKSLVDPYTLQHAAQHSQQSTTDIYARGRSDAAKKVVELRRKR